MVVSKKEKMAAGESPTDSKEQLPLLVLVAGVTSGAGKTSLAEALVNILARRNSTAAAKITVTHGERGCPHGGKGCDVCGSLGGQFQLITRQSIISQPGTDTARLALAGASPVLWTIAREQFIADAWREMQSKLLGVKFVVVESNTLAAVTTPALTLMIVDPTVSRRLWKPSAERLIATSDCLIFNDRGPEDKRHALLKEIEGLRGATEDLIFVDHPHEIEKHGVFMQHLDRACMGMTAPTAF